MESWTRSLKPRLHDWASGLKEVEGAGGLFESVPSRLPGLLGFLKFFQQLCHTGCVALCAFSNLLLVLLLQTLMNAWRTMAAAITSAGTRWAPSSAAARKATSF